MESATADSAKASRFDETDDVESFREDWDSLKSADGYLNATIDFADGSQWKCIKALSQTKYQQGQPPFEATQVYECFCVKDPSSAHREGQEAVIKAKYQVQGTPESLVFFYTYVQTHQSTLRRRTNSENYAKVYDECMQAEQLLHQATQPVEMAHRYTIQEIRALRHLKKTSCQHTPHLIDIDGTFVTADIDEAAMVGGYTIFMLMTKLPGQRIEYDMFWSKTLEERQEIRLAFKMAMIEVWKCNLDPQDWSMHNVMWDDVERKCYIVDFEDYALIPDPDAVLAEMWEDGCWRAWGLAEECRRAE